MPGKHARGDTSPGTQDTINVARPQIKPSTLRIRLKLSPKKIDTEPDPVLSRPKRNASRPARYSDYVIEPPTKKRASAAVVSSSRTSPSSPPAMRSEDNPRSAGYGADFLLNFVEDTPSRIDSGLDLMPESASSLLSDVPDQQPNLPDAISSPQKLDSPEQIINKLQVACHALSNLNIPPVSNPSDIASPPYVSKITSPLRDAETLLNAAAESDDDVEGHELSSHTGTPDLDLLHLIRNAIQILRNHIIGKTHLEGRARSAAGKAQGKAEVKATKRSKKTPYSSEPERFAMDSLELLLDGSATNIGCIVPKDRARLMWHLYNQLIYLVVAPHFVLQKQYHFLNQPNNFAGPHPTFAQQPVPEPHQFLVRQAGQYLAPKQSSSLKDKPKVSDKRG